MRAPWLFACAWLLAGALAPAAKAQAFPAEPAPASRCLLMARNAPEGWQAEVVKVGLSEAQASMREVRIRFVGHSTFVIESPEGVRVATDYNGYVGSEDLPHVVTMNRAHGTHYTTNPDPGIGHVLPGWNPEGGPADHNLKVGDVVIRSVPTDIRGYAAGRDVAGNSIFIFEVADLCIGHLGHLHEVLGYEEVGYIGQLDVVMVPADGVYTMNHTAMAQSLRVIRARLVLPMHHFGASTLRGFLNNLATDHEIEFREEPAITVSRASLPDRPTVVVLPGR